MNLWPKFETFVLDWPGGPWWVALLLPLWLLSIPVYLVMARRMYR